MIWDDASSEGPSLVRQTQAGFLTFPSGVPVTFPSGEPVRFIS